MHTNSLSLSLSNKSRLLQLGKVFFVAFLFLFSASSASAAVIYVSQTATNGYAIGADTCTRVAVTRSTPCLTIIKALSIANSGDTVTINDGTYNETSYLAPSVTNLTITAETDYQAIIRTSDATHVLYLGSLGAGLTIGKVVLDANNTTTNSINTGSGNSTLTINGTKFLNYTGNAISSVTLTSLTMLGGWSAVSSGASVTYGLSLQPSFAATYNISNGTITHSAMTLGSSLIRVSPTATGVNLTVHDVVFNATEVSGNYNVFGINTSGASSVIAYNNTFTFIGALTGTSIQIPNHATLTTSNVTLYNNTGNLGFDQSIGGTYLMLVGDDGTPTTSNNINNVLVYGNSFSNANHGYSMGHISGARVYRNTADYVAIALLSKNDGVGTGTGNTFNDNIIKHDANLITPGNGWPMFSKGGVNDVFANNTVIVTSGYIPGKIEYADLYNTGQYATGVKFYYNNIYSEVNGALFTSVGANSTAIFSQNNYYSTIALSGYPFSYQGAYYSSVELWQVAHESGVNAFTPQNPLFANYASGDYSLLEASRLIDAGTDAYSTSDFLGNPIYGTPDIGSYEYQPPYTVGTNNIPTTGSARIYSNGKYRMTTASTTSATAGLTVTPQGGIYQSTTTQYMDITINTWNTSGNYAKQWTATSTTGSFLTHATSTVYTVPNLNPTSQYTLIMDGVATTTAITNNSQCTNSVCIADGSGQIQFTYTGGYSTHTFGIQDVTAPTLTEVTAISATTTDNTPSYVFSSNESGTILYAGSCSSGTTSITASTNTTVTFSTLSDGTYTNCKVSVIDAAGNDSATTTLSSFTVDTTAPSASLSSPSGASTNSSPVFVWSGSDITTGVASYDLYLDGSLVTSGAATSYTPGSPLSCSSHTWYVRATDNVSLTADSNSLTFTVSCGGGGPIMSSGSFTFNVPKPRMQTITDGIVTYLDEKVNAPATPVPSMTTPISVSTPTFMRPLKRGSRGSDVRMLQEFFKKDPTIYPEGLVTGYYGALTEQAVQRFQKKYGIAAGGIPGYGTVGPKTRAKLNALVGE